MFRLGKTHTVFEENAALRASIEEVVEERGKPMGKYSSEARAAHFGPPLFCNGASGFYRLDNRHNKSGASASLVAPVCAFIERLLSTSCHILSHLVKSCHMF